MTRLWAGHVAGGVAGEEDDRAFQLPVPAHPLHGTFGDEPPLHFCGNPLRRWEGSGAQGVDADLVLGPVDGQNGASI